MTKLTLSATKRTVLGRKVKKLRITGILPANLFGKSLPSLNIQIDTKDFKKLFSRVGESTLFYLQVKGENDPRPVMVSEVASNPVSGQLLHASFHQVDLKEKVTAPVKIHLIGESSAEKEGLGVLVQQLDELEIEALPADMPEHLDIDVSVLTQVDQSILVKDIKLSPKLTIKSDPDTIVLKVEPPAKEEVEEKPKPAEEGTQLPAEESPAEVPAPPKEEK